MCIVGYQTRINEDDERLSWDSLAPRPLAWSAWYPASANPAGRGHLKGQFFDPGDVWVDGELADDPSFPVALMSHGTGGSPESIGWLARILATHGYVVIGAHHHGNTAWEPYQAEGFLCWWERALDLSALLSRLCQRGPFAGRLDLHRVHSVGFSLGGHTVLALAGARTSVERYVTWSSDLGLLASGPREFPDVGGHIPRLLESSEIFRKSWARQNESFLDRRIRSVVALAPAPPVRAFDVASVRSIRIPVTLVTGEADTEAPSRECADWLIQTNPDFHRVSVGEDVGHYTFLGFPARDVSGDNAFVFSDAPGVNRAEIHDRIAKAVTAAIGST